jgi:hypothetical protein
MQIYNYSKETGEYISEQMAQVDPLESIKSGQDVFLIPANTTSIIPPASQIGKARCFINGSWIYMDDHRGETIYKKSDGTSLIVTYIGPISDDYTSLAPFTDSSWDGEAWKLDFVIRKKRITDLMQAYMDAKARAYGYDNILSAKSYVTSTNATWRAEGEAFRNWQDAVRTFGLGLLAEHEAGTNIITTEEALIAALPPFPLDP